MPRDTSAGSVNRNQVWDPRAMLTRASLPSPFERDVIGRPWVLAWACAGHEKSGETTVDFLRNVRLTRFASDSSVKQSKPGMQEWNKT